MEIRKSKETLILTQSEKAILSKAYDILYDIYKESEEENSIEEYSYAAGTNIKYLLEDAEIEGGEPKEKITLTIEI